MRRILQYISAKITRISDNGDTKLQGSGTIIQSHGQYYLLTAYHCLCKKDEDGNEIIPADWQKTTATVFTADSEYQLCITGVGDVDSTQDWAILKIEKPQDTLSANTKVWLTDEIDYANNTNYASYGFPHTLIDGIYLEFTPTNNRGVFWRIHDTVEGGNIKAITIEKGASGMGLFRKTEDMLFCLGLINKSAPEGAMNAMQRVSAKHLKDFFNDIYIPNEKKPIQPQSLTEEQVIQNMACSNNIQEDELVLCNEYNQKILQGDYEEAAKMADMLHKRHPDNEDILLNLLYATALSNKERLKDLEITALNFVYSHPESVAFAAKIFCNNGYPQTAADIFYTNAMRMNDPTLDSLYYVEAALNPTLQTVVRKEYNTIEEGKCVLYRDGQDRRHCWMITRQSEMGNILIGHHTNETISVKIAGEERKITIIAIYDKYFALEHRAVTDVMEHGANSILTPLKFKENASGEEMLNQLLDFIRGVGSNKSIMERMRDAYDKKPSLLSSSCIDDLVPSYYYMLFTDFQLMERPEELSSTRRFDLINSQTEFVLDLSSFLMLAEKYFQTDIDFKRMFIIPKFLKAIVEEYCNTIMKSPSLLMHQVLSAGKIYKFSEDATCDMEKRIDNLRTFMTRFCICESEKIPFEVKEDMRTVDRLLFLNTMMLLQKRNRVLVTEDWYYSIALQGQVLMINSNEYARIFS